MSNQLKTKEKKVTFYIDDIEVTSNSNETLWKIAKKNNKNIPHLCLKDSNNYRPDGNCRACMVEIEGEKNLSASCIRYPSEGMKVKTFGTRVQKNRKLIFELLASDMPLKENCPDPNSHFWKQYESIGLDKNYRLPAGRPGAQSEIPIKSILNDISHPSIAVNLDACISCGLCERACREVQVNDVIGMEGRSHNSLPVFDVKDELGNSTCVGCGECVQACPTGALIEKSFMDSHGVKREKYPDEVKKSLCPFCGVGCQTEVQLLNNDILSVNGRNGPANKGKLCVKGRFGMDYVMSEERLTKPLIRKKESIKNPEIKINFHNYHAHFEEVSWEQALDFAANGLMKTKNIFSGKAIAGFGSAKCTNEEAFLFQKLMRQVFNTNNVDHCTRLCHASSVAALMEGIGSGAVTIPFTAAEDSECIILIGANPEKNHPVASTFLKNAAKKGTKLIVLDVVKQNLMRYASHGLVFHPGTDVSLLNAMIFTIIEEELYDKEYIKTFTEGFEDLKSSIKLYSPEKMEKICKVSSKHIREIARVYSKSSKSIIFWGMGISQHIHGTDNARCLITLSLITGNIGKPGAGIHPLRGQNNVQGASDAGLIPMVYPDYKSVTDDEIRLKYEKEWDCSLDNNPGLTVVEIINQILKSNIKAMYILGENPAMSDPDQTKTRLALSQLEHLIVQDIFFTETASFADVIFPATAQPEKSGTYTNSNRQIQIAKQIRTPPGNARQDWELITEIAKRCGHNWKYKEVKDVFNEMSIFMNSLNNISWERLEKEDAVCYPSQNINQPGDEVIFSEGFPTKSGLAKIVPVSLSEPNELPDSKYPLILTTGRLLEHWHTGAMTRRSYDLNIQEPEATVSMNPEDIKKLSLIRGEMVRVETRRGSISLILREDRNISMGILFIPFCYLEAPANFLTDSSLDPFGKIPEFKFSAAKVVSLKEAV